MANAPTPIVPQLPIVPIAGVHTGTKATDLQANQLAQSVNTTLNQLVAYVQPTIDTTGNTANGYYKFSNGLILQWGYEPATNATFSYPIPFTSAVFCLNATPTVMGAYSDPALIHPDSTNPLTQFFLRTTNSSNGSGSAFPCYWFALGV